MQKKMAQSRKRAEAGKNDALANRHGAWPHASVKKQENQRHGGRGCFVGSVRMGFVCGRYANSSRLAEIPDYLPASHTWHHRVCVGMEGPEES
ncbi:hypothetical protein [Ochrobactrum sp. Marseille-Q0166]|uniref:hypothetical protein n=1 Tax=Ochrobactrum sp. Marseille-Q0166 TaxID=2761105 RepID=UPI00165617CA|nr:hypothetical protein [Ochrobactrum sp. Marseille-Q0166]MBC8718209.1 hypothetical protein [Ochrobactrum sp. Marseille-Q0166]